ncbi:hypothetical protein DEO72_LG8g874 [Vigna unguiculata]|uniref:Uncharacterized protein n=1 Tax=Vigna unguiculata TaxID=3917 RepID=A0A4D6MRW6_VIGUN|nr:hypothetical protein DEO72_LG8g874 [Vigna unguiculata]
MKHPTRLMTAHITFRYGRSQPLVYGLQQSLVAAYLTQVPPTAYVTPNALPEEHGPQQDRGLHTHRRQPHNYAVLGDHPGGCLPRVTDRIPHITSILPQDSPDP